MNVYHDVIVLHQEQLKYYEQLHQTKGSEEKRLEHLVKQFHDVKAALELETKLVLDKLNDDTIAATQSQQEQTTSAGKKRAKASKRKPGNERPDFKKSTKWLKLEREQADLQRAINKQQKVFEDVRDRKLEQQYMDRAASYLNDYHYVSLQFDLKLREMRRQISSSTNLDLDKQILAVQTGKQRQLGQLSADYIREFRPDIEKKVSTASGSSNSHCPGVVGLPNVGDKPGMCNECGVEAVMASRTENTCANCAFVQSQVVGIAWDAAQQKTTYKRINHCREYLRQLQGKSRAKINEWLIRLMRNSMDRMLLEPKDVTLIHVREWLRLERLTNTYGEKAVQILCILNPTFNAVNIDPEHEEIICQQFLETQQPYEEVKAEANRNPKRGKPKRSSYLSYPYVSYQISRLQGWTEYLPYITMLKSQEKLIEADNYWDAICKILGWSFFRVIGNVEGNVDR
jgi:hypothetical protein